MNGLNIGMNVSVSLQAVVDKLRPCGQISYAEVARAAERAGRRRLATMLLDLEPLAEDQVNKKTNSKRQR